jgi:hypothetical protein
LEVEEVLGAEVAFRPLGAGGELHSDEVSDFAVKAIADAADELILARSPANLDAKGDGVIQLKADSGGRDVLQETGHGGPFSCMVLPGDLYHIRAEHASLGTTFLHTLSIGAEPPEL